MKGRNGNEDTHESKPRVGAENTDTCSEKEKKTKKEEEERREEKQKNTQIASEAS